MTCALIRTLHYSFDGTDGYLTDMATWPILKRQRAPHIPGMFGRIPRILEWVIYSSCVATVFWIPIYLSHHADWALFLFALGIVFVTVFLEYRTTSVAVRHYPGIASFLDESDPNGPIWKRLEAALPKSRLHRWRLSWYRSGQWKPRLRLYIVIAKLSWKLTLAARSHRSPATEHRSAHELSTFKTAEEGPPGES